MKACLALTWVVLAMAMPAYAGMPSIALTPEWTARIQAMAPAKPTVEPRAPRKALLFSRMTGYKHWVTPHTAEVVKMLGKKSGAYEVVETNDVSVFEPGNISPFDIVILNNNCSDGSEWNLFFDVTGDMDKATMLERSLIARVADGKGLVVLHGAIVMQNKSPEFGKMLGGSFDFHPAQQEITCRIVDPTHPLTKAFGGRPLVHVDEPYLFNGAYKDRDFRPLLEMDTSRLDCGGKDQAVRAEARYVAWIKKSGKGRVFYCSPSHNAQSFDKPELLQFMLDGIQYAAGDLECDDTPLKPAR